MAEELEPKTPCFKVGLHNNPHFEKRYKGGEDGYLVSANKRLIGVADGVGGWASKEVCSGVCARFMCKTIGEGFEADNGTSLMDLLLRGY